jgi:endonuclease YncB( thermonuclease family)
MTFLHCITATTLLWGLAHSACAGSFEGVVTHVTDGDSLWVRPASGGAPREVRLRGIDAPEICQPHGAASREALAARVLHQRVMVASRMRDDYQRALGNVSQGGKDLGRWMVSRGHAWSYRFRRDPGPYAKEEAHARRARLGLWSGHTPLRPRDFRKRHGSCKAGS